MTYRRVLCIQNESRNLSLVRKEAADVLSRTPFDRETCNKIIVAVDEALANVVEHAYGGGRGEVQVHFEVDAEFLRVAIRDNGVKFDPGERLNSTLDIHNHIKLGLKGGLGLFLMRKIMDEVRYNGESEHCVNELVMVKRLPAPAGEAPADVPPGSPGPA